MLSTCGVRRDRTLASRTACTLLLVLGLGPAAAAQQAAGPARVERPITPTGSGPQRLVVDVPLVAEAARFRTVETFGPPPARAHGGLDDLRIVDAFGNEVPYLLMHAPARQPAWIGTAVLPIAITEKTSGFEADLGHPRIVDQIRVEGLPEPFLKRLVLEGSGDRVHWTMLAPEGTLFDLPEQRLQQHGVPFRAGSYRYLRVTWDDTNSGRVPLPRRVLARVVEADGLPDAPLTAAAGVDRRASEPGRSRYRITLPAAGLPIVALTLDVGTGHVFRRAAVSEARLSGSEAVPVELGREMLARVERGGVTAAALRVPISPPREAQIDLVIEDGSNPPLDLRGVSIEFAELPWIYFEAAGGPLLAQYGRAGATAPKYDLEAVRSSVRLADVPEARWGEPRAASEVTSPPPQPPLAETGATIDPAGFRHQRAIPIEATGLFALQLDAAALAHSKGPESKFADVRIADGSARQVPYLLERRDEPIAIDLPLRAAPSAAPSLRSEPGHHRSVYAVSLPYPGLPSARLVLQTSERVFRRSVQIVRERPADRRHRDAWVEVLASAVWQHADAGSEAPALLLPVARGDATQLLVVVDEGDNRPLALSGARLLLPSWRLRFHSAGGPLRLLYGQDGLQPPRYDIELLAPQVMGAEAAEVAAAEETIVEARRPTLITPTAFYVALAAAVLVLLGVIVRLVTSTEAQSQPSPPAP
jgi:hypothetical protein